MADKERIAQVVLNLLDNAIKYNKLNGKVTISYKEDKKLLKVNIADTGLGIPAKDLDRVFERFYRVDKARSRELGGTGLGLSIVKHIIDAHGGKVAVESTLDKGSTFSISLPKA
jgi:two-component system phosphate regulon sensor histidine kinase PhoR